jgi:nitric oxide reductase activation protein
LIEVPQLVNTAAAADLTIRICQLLQTPAATAPAVPPNAKPERDEPTDQAENNGESTAATHTEAQTGTANSGGGAGVAADDPLQRTLAASADDMAGDLFTATRQALEDVSDNNAFGVLLPVGEAVEIAPQGQQFVRKVQAESRALSAKLQGLVQAKRRDRCYAVPQGNRLLSKRLYRVGMGETRLFARHTERTAPNTAVHLLVDLSGSMHQSLAGSSLGQIAQDAALALALALDAIAGVSVAVTAFPGQSGDSDRVACLMKHGQSPRTQAGAFTQSARGGTPLAQGLWYAAADLMLRTETRRMVLVITDGQPNDPKGALDIIRQCEQAGMMVVGIGIGCDVSALFAHHILIKTVSDLQHTLFELTEQFLV